MSVDLPAIGVSGIYAAEAELAATESNITNASNPNYSAETVNLAASAGPDGSGDGVSVLGTERSQAPFLNEQINAQSSSESFSQAYAQVGALAQNFIAPASGDDLSQAYQNMINAFTNLSASPQDTTMRSAAISAAGSFAQNAQSLSSNLELTATNELSQLGGLVSQVNNLDNQVAQLNSEIQGTQAGGGSGAALLDQRDALIGQLASLIGASADANGDVSIGGLPLVSGASAVTLKTTGSGTAVGLEVTLPQGTLPVPADQVGGTIGGTLAGAARVLQLQSSLNQYATSLASKLNSIYQTGYGLDGSTGNQLFSVPGSSGGPIALNPAVTVQNFAAAGSAAGVPGDGSNAGALAATASVQGIDVALPSATPVQAFAQIESQFGSDLSGAQSNQQQTSATLQSLQQLKSSITGVSLNDQLSNLIQYQNALEAAGRAVQAADDITLFLIQELNQ